MSSPVAADVSPIEPIQGLGQGGAIEAGTRAGVCHDFQLPALAVRFSLDGSALRVEPGAGFDQYLQLTADISSSQHGSSFTILIA